MPSDTPQPTKTVIAAQLAALLLAAAILIPAVRPHSAAVGGPWIKILFLARMAALVALAHGLLRGRSSGWSALGLERPHWRRFLIALVAGTAMTVLLSVLAPALLTSVGLPIPDYSAFAPVRGDLSEFLFWAIPVSIGTAGFGEELVFRGFVTDALERLLPGSRRAALGAALVVQAVIFGVLHFYQGPGGMIVAGLTGLVFGLTWLIAGRNLWPGIVLHALMDASAMTAIFLGANMS